jgi:hypothetical protein
VRHHDLVSLIEDEVSGTGQLSQTGPDRLDVDHHVIGKVARCRSTPDLSEGAVDGKPQILKVHSKILAEPASDGHDCRCVTRVDGCWPAGVAQAVRRCGPRQACGLRAPALRAFT